MVDNAAHTPDPHLASADIAFTTATELISELTSGQRTSSEVVSVLLSRISAVDTADTDIALSAVLAIAADAEQIAAERDDERAHGTLRGPLHGVPVLIKDNIEAVGLPATAGATSLSNRPVTTDSTVAQRLRAAGAIIIGATNLSEWANIRSPHSSSGWSAVGGLTGNPWALDRSAGGSSSGSGAAVAAGFAPLAVGTETDGSIVCPGSLNGVVGIKPTVGVVPTKGVVPISASQDSPGPMTRSVADAAALLEVLGGLENLVAQTQVQSDLCIGVMRNYRTGHPGTDALFDEVVEQLAGAGVSLCDVGVEVPNGTVSGDELTVLLCELKDDLNAYLPMRGASGPQSITDVLAHEQANASIELAHFGHEFFVQAAASEGRAGAAYKEARARNLQWALEVCLEPAIAKCDVLIAASYAPAWKIDVTNGDQGLASPITRPAAISGWPIATVPMGLVGGMPVGLAIIARAHNEATLVRAAATIEQRLGLVNSLRPAWRQPRRG